MNQEKQPESLRLADALEYISNNSEDNWQAFDEAAAELRRLHALVESQKEEVSSLYGWLAECRDAFSLPAVNTELDHHFCGAMTDPCEVPAYVVAQAKSLEAQLSAIGAGGVEALRKPSTVNSESPYTTAEESASVMRAKPETPAEKLVNQMIEDRWLNEQGVAPEAYTRGLFDIAAELAANMQAAQPSRECLQQSAEPSNHVESEGVSALDLTQDRLKEYLTYDPETGIFTSLISGKQIGWKGWKGYVSLAVWDVTYRAHRLAWLYMTGEWPENLIDHRDGNKSNNRFSNLRESTHSQNSANGKSKASAIGLPRGVRKASNSKSFKAEITVHNRKIHLGCFPTAEEASEVYTLASELIHGDYAYHLSRNKG